MSRCSQHKKYRTPHPIFLAEFGIFYKVRFLKFCISYAITESLSLRRRTFSIFYFSYTTVTDNLNSQPVWIAENCNILLNKNFLKNIPFSLNSQLLFAAGIFFNKSNDSKSADFTFFDSIWFYSTILLRFYYQFKQNVDMTFRSQIQWQLFDLDTYEERLKYRYITDWNHNSRVNRYIRSISGICRDNFLLFKILWHMQKSQTMHLHMTCRSDFKNKQTLVLHIRLSWQLKAISK